VDVAHIDTMLLALRTEGFSGRDIVNVVDNAKIIAISAKAPKKKVGTGAALDKALQDILSKAVDKKLVLTFDHLLKAVERYEPVISKRSIRSCERFIEENTMDLGTGVEKTTDVSELLMVEKRTIEKKARAELEAMKSAQAEEIKELLEEERKKVMKRLQQEKAEMDKIHSDKLKRLKDQREEEVESLLKKEKIRYKKEMEKLKSEKEAEVKRTLLMQRKKLKNELLGLEKKMEKEKELQKKKALQETQRRLKEEEAKLNDMRRRAAKKAAERQAQVQAKKVRKSVGMEWDEEDDEDDEDEISFDEEFVSWD